MCTTFPRMDSLIPLGGGLISEAQEALLRKRYDEHAGEYVLEDVPHKDGLPVNACMNADTVNDIEEEIVDAVFNCLILLLKTEGFESPTEKIYRRKAERLLDFMLLTWDRVEEVR